MNTPTTVSSPQASSTHAPVVRKRHLFGPIGILILIGLHFYPQRRGGECPEKLRPLFVSVSVWGRKGCTRRRDPVSPSRCWFYNFLRRRPSANRQRFSTGPFLVHAFWVCRKQNHRKRRKTTHNHYKTYHRPTMAATLQRRSQRETAYEISKKKKTTNAAVKPFTGRTEKKALQQQQPPPAATTSNNKTAQKLLSEGAYRPCSSFQASDVYVTEQRVSSRKSPL
jgi:hypothetical protein